MVVTGQLSLTAYAGEDYVATGTHVTSAVNTTPVNIAGWTIKATIRNRPGDANPSLLQVAATVTNGPAGLYTVSLSATQTTALGVGNFAIDIWRTDPGANTEMAIGTLAILQPVYH